MIQKRFPADIDLEELTFLNDRKLNAELYAVFQSYSMPIKGQTIVEKDKLPSNTVLCKQARIGDQRTLKKHLQYLIDGGWIIEDKEHNRYILPNKEDIYLLLPLDTLIYIRDTMTEPVIKTYIYLGQCWKYKHNYEFTYQEIATHLGIKRLTGNKSAYSSINNILTALQNNGMIQVSKPYRLGNSVRYKLTNWSEHYIKSVKKDVQ